MKTPPTSPLTAAQREALEARFALRVAARLEEGARAVPHDIGERLRVAREQAVGAARHARASAAAAGTAQVQQGTITVGVGVGVGAMGLSGATPGGTGGLGTGPLPSLTDMVSGWQAAAPARAPGRSRPIEDAPPSWGWRLAGLLPAIALVAGLWGIRHYAQHEQVEATTEVDLQLLTDDLPPDAYADPGFEEFLSRDSGPAVRPIEDVPADAGGDLVTTDTPPDLGESDAPFVPPLRRNYR